MTTPKDGESSRVFSAYMAQVLGGGDSRPGFLTGETRNLMNPNFGREGMPRLTSFQQMEENKEHLLDTATDVIAEFIKSPHVVREEMAEMSPALIDFLAHYPYFGTYLTRNMNRQPLHAEAYVVGIQLAHRIHRNAGLLPEITTDDLNRIESREGAFGGIGALMTQSLEMASDYGHHDLGKKITAVTAGIPIEQRKSIETAFRHFASIVVRKQLDVI